MIVFMVLLAVIVIYRMKFSSFYTDYLDKEQSTAIRGVFAAVIFLSHAKGYILLGNGAGDTLFKLVLYILGQCIVAMYFFYSGYGIMESYKYKKDYTTHFFRNRILKTLIHFDLAVILYMILKFAYRKTYTLRTYFLSLLGWTSIGNSNWFVCVLLMLYLLTLLAFAVVRNRNAKAVGILVLILSIVLWIVLDRVNVGGYWYNTMLCYAAGMIVSVYKETIDSKMQDTKNYCICFAGLMLIIALCYLNRGTNLVYSIFSLCFSLAVVMITMKVKINNKYLQFLGRYSFSIFILQRIPMYILYRSQISNPVIFTSLALACTLLIAMVFDRLLKNLDKKIVYKTA